MSAKVENYLYDFEADFMNRLSTSLKSRKHESTESVTFANLTYGEGEKDLGGGCSPDVERLELIPVGREVELDAFDGAVQPRGVDEEGSQDEVGGEGDHVGRLAVRSDALPQDQTDDDPGA